MEALKVRNIETSTPPAAQSAPPSAKAKADVARHVDADEARRARIDGDGADRRAGARPGQREVEADADARGEGEARPAGWPRRVDAEHVDRHEQVGVAVVLAAEERRA